KKGTISVHTEELEDFIKIEISDNGPGIPDKMKHMIFKPGFSTKFDANGDIYRGIGLSHVRILMEEQYQGTITVCPNQPNGTTFTLLFRKNRFKLGDNT
ncbi:TPA: ATP-binding protein, partial [Streptococcus agalactiae]|nr:ATP-binding protein [Streptococcus agalactiae]